ncbi:MAG: YigZ family protein, partial [Bacteroidota bacterium]|nr:YigZ family protein [Bacteroidota bacterium]
RLGADKNIYRYSDDGEPANSSGPPIFNAIKSYSVSDILIVVIRYFGGKKLGIPGLINAYNTAAKEALDNAKIITKTIEETLNLDFQFNQLNLVMRGIKKRNLKIVSQKFTSECSIEISVRKSKKEETVNYFTNLNINIK